MSVLRRHEVPYENLRKAFRTSQKHIERDLTAVQTTAHELEKKPYDALETLRALDGMITKVEGLKSKVRPLPAAPSC